MNRKLLGVIAMTALLAPASAQAFPRVRAQEHNVLICHYLLSAHILITARLNKTTVDMTQLPQCQTLPRGTEVVAEDSDGGAFIGVTLPNSADPKALWWTYQGWFREVPY